MSHMQKEEINLSEEVQKRMLWWRYFNPTKKWVYWLRRLAGPFCIMMGLSLLYQSHQDWKLFYAAFCIAFGIYYLVRPFIIMLRQKGIVEKKIQVSIENKMLVVEENGSKQEIDLSFWDYKIHNRFIELRREKTSLLLPRNQISDTLEDEILATLKA